MSDEPNLGGRPTKYREEYCTDVVEWGKRGKSKEWMCAEIDITERTMKNWENAHPEFAEALARAVVHSQRWWEDRGQESLETLGFQASMWSRSMAARFPKSWREKTATEHSGPDGKPMQIEEVSAISLIESRIDSIIARRSTQGSDEGTK